MGKVGSSTPNRTVRRRTFLFGSLAAAVALMALSGCGSSSSDSASAPVDPGLLNASEISRYPRGSVERDFLEYWSNMQFRSWVDVAAYYDPQFRDFVGTANLINAKKVNGSSYPVLRPHISRVEKGDEGTTTIYYTLVLAEGTKELDSITWRKDGGNWQIIYDSRLDAELGQAATTQAEADSGASTDASTPTADAVRAGGEAEQLQAQFLERELHVKQP